MILEVKINTINLVSPDIKKEYEHAYVLVKGMEEIMNDDKIELRRTLINQYGDGDKIYILVPDKATETHIIVSDIKGQPPHKPQRKSTISSSSDIKILYKKEVD